jgi:hypothetical protein
VKNYTGCNTQYKGLLKYWRSIDKYIIEADKILCSKECICKTNNKIKELFNNDPISKNIYKSYYFTDVNSDKLKVQDCETQIQSLYDQKYLSYYNVEIEGNRFNKFWRKIEEKFECSGFCQTNYQVYDLKNQEEEELINYSGQIPLVKYIFSDFSKGPVKHKGCFKLLVNWIIKFLLSFGIIGLASGLLQLIILLFQISLLFEMFNSVHDEYENNNKEEEEAVSELKENEI